MKEELIQLLRHREQVIADHPWRDRDPAAHLDALKSVSLQIDDWVALHGAQCDAKLRHFLTQSSFAKALAHLEASEQQGCR